MSRSLVACAAGSTQAATRISSQQFGLGAPVNLALLDACRHPSEVATLRRLVLRNASDLRLPARDCTHARGLSLTASFAARGRRVLNRPARNDQPLLGARGPSDQASVVCSGTRSWNGNLACDLLNWWRRDGPCWPAWEHASRSVRLPVRRLQRGGRNSISCSAPRWGRTSDDRPCALSAGSVHVLSMGGSDQLPCGHPADRRARGCARRRTARQPNGGRECPDRSRAARTRERRLQAPSVHSRTPVLVDDRRETQLDVEFRSSTDSRSTTTGAQ